MNALDYQSAPLSVFECIEQRQWQKAIDIVSGDPGAVYETSNHAKRGNPSTTETNDDIDENHNVLAIHALCKIASSTTSVRFSKDEFSDDEEEDEEDIDSQQQGHNLTPDNNDAAELDNIFEACELEEGNKIFEVTQYMIDVSHSLGARKVVIPRDRYQDDAENEITDIDEDVPSEEQHLNLDGTDEEKNATQDCGVHESILTVRDSRGKTPLHILCENSCDINMMKLILESTREASGNPRAPSALSLILAKDSNGATPLHYVSYSRECPFSSLKLIMDYCHPRWGSYPLASGHNEVGGDSAASPFRWIDPSLSVDKDGETPLHWALDGYMSSRRIQELTKHSLDAIMVKNRQRKRPFDQFTANFIDSDWTAEHDSLGREAWDNIEEYLRVIHHNYKKQRKSSYNHSTTSTICSSPTRTEKPSDRKMQSQSSEWLPLHFLAGSPYEFPSLFMDLALKYREDDLHRLDRHGKLPLHLACERVSTKLPGTLDESGSKLPGSATEENPTNTTSSKPPTHDDVALKVLKSFPRASTIKVESTNQLALHLAVQTRKPMLLIKYLIRTYPRSLNIQDPHTKLWPFALAVTQHTQRMNSVRSDEHANHHAEDIKAVSMSYSLLRADPSVLHLVKKRPEFPNPIGRLSDDDTGSDESYMEHSSRRIRRLTIRDD